MDILDRLKGKVAASVEIEKDLRRELCGIPAHLTNVGSIREDDLRDVLSELEQQQALTERFRFQVAAYEHELECEAKLSRAVRGAKRRVRKSHC